MSAAEETPGAHVRVLVAGGGVAALEVVLALWARTAGQLRPTLLAPEASFRYRPLAAYSDLVAGPGPTVDLVRFVAEHGAGLVDDRLARVVPDDGLVVTGHGGRIAYDALVLATGATHQPGLPGALTLGDPRDARAIEDLVQRVRGGSVERLAIIVPPGVSWSLPAYELALLLEHAVPRGAATRVAVVTAEAAPMAAAGDEFGAALTDLLDRRGIELDCSTWPEEVGDGYLWMPLQGASRVDAVVALARPRGPSLPGLPCDAAGFVIVDADGRVDGQRRIWAAGDVAAHPIKQGGLAVQQADVVADDVARRLGLEPLSTSNVGPEPVLRVALLDGESTLYLRTERTDGALRTVTSREPLWWPPAKIAGGRLANYLAARESADDTAGTARTT